MKSSAPGETGGEGESPQNIEGQQYVDHKSYLTLEIRLARPMVSTMFTTI